MKKKPEPLIVGEREVSAPGAIMKVVVLELSPEAKQLLTVKPYVNIVDRIWKGEFDLKDPGPYSVYEVRKILAERQEKFEREFSNDSWFDKALEKLKKIIK